jgi:hypothetical protein
MDKNNYIEVIDFLKGKAKKYDVFKKRYTDRLTTKDNLFAAEDEFEKSLKDNQFKIQIPQLKVLIEYDKGYEVSRREISVLGIELAYGDIYLNAIDLTPESGGYKNFKLKNISEVINIETGESINYFLDIVKMLTENSEIDNSVMLTDSIKERKVIGSIFIECKDDLIILSYLANSDGDYHINEQKVMYDYVDEILKLIDFSGTESKIKDVISCLNPSVRTFNQAIKRLEKKLDGSSEYIPLFDAVYKLIKADGVICDKEKSIINKNNVLDI